MQNLKQQIQAKRDAAIVRRYRDGEPVGNIARTCGISRRRVRQIVRRAWEEYQKS